MHAYSRNGHVGHDQLRFLATVPSSLAEKVAVRVVAEPSTSSRIIQPRFVLAPETKLATSAVTVPPTTYAPAARFWQPAGVPTLNDPLREAVAGLLIVVPNGWLFQVMTPSVHAAPTLKMSRVRQAAGTAVIYRRRVASRTIAETGMAGCAGGEVELQVDALVDRCPGRNGQGVRRAEVRRGGPLSHGRIDDSRRRDRRRGDRARPIGSKGLRRQVHVRSRSRRETDPDGEADDDGCHPRSFRSHGPIRRDRSVRLVETATALARVTVTEPPAAGTTADPLEFVAPLLTVTWSVAVPQAAGRPLTVTLITVAPESSGGPRAPRRCTVASPRWRRQGVST